MPKAIILALEELWQFFWGSLGFGVVLGGASNVLADGKTTLALPGVDVETDIPVATFTSVPPNQFYIIKNSWLLREPYLQFDGALGHLDFGEAVTVKEYWGDYGLVLSAFGSGWVRKDALTSDRSLVWPQLQNNHLYEANTPAVQSIRAVLADDFHTQDLYLPLLSPEYVAFKLKADGVNIPWPQGHKERSAGNWQAILKGVASVRIGLSPKSGSVMEWYQEDGEAALAYVEAVLSDESIVISTVGLDYLGQYTSLNLPKTTWLEWSPVFIEIL